MDVADAWLAPAALFLSGMAAVRADPWLVNADILLAAALAVGAVASLGGARITRGLVPHLLLVTIDVTVAAFVGAFEVLVAMRRVHAPATAVAATRRRAHRLAGARAGSRPSPAACWWRSRWWWCSLPCSRRRTRCSIGSPATCCPGGWTSISPAPRIAQPW